MSYEYTIGTSGTTVTGSGATPYLAYWSGTKTLTHSTNLHWNNTNATLSIGGTDAMTVNGTAITTHLATHAADGLTETNVEFHKHGTTAASGAIVYFARSRGSAATPAVVSSGDTLAYIGITGYDGTDYALGGYLKWTVGTTPGSNDMPTSLAIGLSPDGSQTPTDVFTINYTGAAALSNTLSVTTSVTSPIIIGSTSASGTLTLRATSNATDGDIIFETDPTTERVRILNTGEFIVGGTSLITTEVVSVQKNQNALTGVWVSNTTSGTAARSVIGAIGASNLGVFVQSLSAGYTTSNILVADTGVVSCNNVAGFNLGTTANTQLSFWTNNTKRVEVSNVGNVSIGGTATRATTVGTNALQIFNGTAPVGTLTNGCSFYSTAGEMRVMDAAGNATLLSPHEKGTNYWIYDSIDTTTGKRLKIDMEQMMKFLNDKFKLNFVHEYDI